MNYFYVYQNKTYHEERRGGFLWSPQYASGWRRHPGYEAMKEVRPGDIIFHSYFGEIVAISKAQSACCSNPRPGRGFEEWSLEGWRIDTEYLVPSRSLVTKPYIPELYRIQPQNGPFSESYRGKQQYLCNANLAMFKFLIEKIIALQPTEAERQAIRDFVELKDGPETGIIPPPPPPPPFTEIELEAVENNCMIDVFLLEKNKASKMSISIAERPFQKAILGKKVGDTFTLPNIPVTYRIEKIYKENN